MIKFEGNMKKTLLGLLLLSCASETLLAGDKQRCVRYGNEIQCESIKEKFKWLTLSKEPWCITTELGYIDGINCVYQTKDECVSRNPIREYNGGRCVKNPKLSAGDDDE